MTEKEKIIDIIKANAHTNGKGRLTLHESMFDDVAGIILENQTGPRLKYYLTLESEGNIHKINVPTYGPVIPQMGESYFKSNAQDESLAEQILKLAKSKDMKDGNIWNHRDWFRKEYDEQTDKFNTIDFDNVEVDDQDLRIDEFMWVKEVITSVHDTGNEEQRIYVILNRL